MRTALVIGARGRTGSRVVDELLGAGWYVTGTVRLPEQVDDLRKVGAHGEVLDLLTTTRDDLRGLMVGVDAIVYAAGSSAGSTAEVVERVDGDAIIAAVDAAVLASVGRFVLVSAHRTDEDFGGDHVVRLLRAKRAADAHLRSTGLGWTILRPDALTDEPSTGAVRLGPTVPHGAIARANLAHLIRVALESPAAVRQQLEVTDGLMPIGTVFGQLPR